MPDSHRSLPSLAVCLSRAKEFYDAAAVIGPMPETWQEREAKVTEMYAVYSNLWKQDQDKAEVFLQSQSGNSQPMLLALYDQLNKMIAQRKMDARGKTWRKRGRRRRR